MADIRVMRPFVSAVVYHRGRETTLPVKVKPIGSDSFKGTPGQWRKLATGYVALFQGNWRRVYSDVSTSGRYFLMTEKARRNDRLYLRMNQ